MATLICASFPFPHSPAFATIAMTQNTDSNGFPPGYFIIRSVGCDRVLDVTSDEIEDGTEVALWLEKEKSLVESN